MKNKHVVLLSTLAVFAMAGCAARNSNTTTAAPAGNTTTAAPSGDTTSAAPSLKYWNINDTKTGATMTEYEVFADFAHKAYASLNSASDGVRVAYGILGGHNLARVEVAVKDGKVKNTTINEVRFDDVVTTDNVSVNGRVMTLNDYKTWSAGLTSQKDLSDLYYALVNNYVFGLDDLGARVDNQKAILSKASYDTDYWAFDIPEGSNAKSRWQWNIKQIEDAFRNKNLATDEITITGATITTKNAYIELAKKAFKGETGVVSYAGADMMEGRASNGHAACIARVELVVGSDKKVVDAHINETDSFVDTLANVSSYTGTDFNSVEYKYSSRGAEKTGRVAKYVKIGDKVLEAAPTTDGSATAIASDYVNDANERLYDTIKTNNFGAHEYFNNVMNHNVHISKTAEGKTEDLIKPVYANKAATKAEYANVYWAKNAPEGYNTRWKWNIAAVEKSFVGVDFTSAPKVEKDK